MEENIARKSAYQRRLNPSEVREIPTHTFLAGLRVYLPENIRRIEVGTPFMYYNNYLID